MDSTYPAGVQPSLVALVCLRWSSHAVRLSVLHRGSAPAPDGDFLQQTDGLNDAVGNTQWWFYVGTRGTLAPQISG